MNQGGISALFPSPPAEPMSSTQPLFDAVRAGDLHTLAEMLEADPSLARLRDEAGLSPILVAGYHGRREAMALLASYAPEMEVGEAAAVGDVRRLRALLDADPAQTTAFSVDGWTPLHLAAFFGRGEAVRLLLERGAAASARSANPMANTPLHAAMAGRLGVDGVRALLDGGAEVDARQHGGFTALHAAAMHGDATIVRLLLDHGADPTLPADDGRTASDFARASGHLAMLALLEDGTATA